MCDSVVQKGCSSGHSPDSRFTKPVVDARTSVACHLGLCVCVLMGMDVCVRVQINDMKCGSAGRMDTHTVPKIWRSIGADSRLLLLGPTES